MLSVDCRRRQELSMQTGGSFLTRKFRLLRNSNILIVSPIVCFAAGHRTIYRNDLRSVDVAYRRLLRSVVGPPRNMDWTLPWHEILHIWNERVRAFTPQTGSKSWSEMCLRHHWHLAQYSQHYLGIVGSRGF